MQVVIVLGRITGRVARTHLTSDGIVVSRMIGRASPYAREIGEMKAPQWQLQPLGIHLHPESEQRQR